MQGYAIDDNVISKVESDNFSIQTVFYNNYANNIQKYHKNG